MSLLQHYEDNKILIDLISDKPQTVVDIIIEFVDSIIVRIYYVTIVISVHQLEITNPIRDIGYR